MDSFIPLRKKPKAGRSHPSGLKKICLVSREMEGIAGAGGLKDVVRDLADALAAEGCDVTVIIPGYGFIPKSDFLYRLEVPVHINPGIIDVYSLDIDGIKLRVLDSPFFSSKFDVYNYVEEDAPSLEFVGKGHSDVNEMNVLFQAGAVLSILKENVPPDVIHGHDGHAGLLPLYMKIFGSHSPGFFDSTGVLITIHNAGREYQQILGTLDEAVGLTGLPEEYLVSGLLENHINPLLIAGVFGHVNTVSPGYAKELLSGDDKFSGKLGPSYKTHGITLRGVYNGINPEFWNRGTRKQCKADLRRQISKTISHGSFDGVRIFGSVPDPEVPWILFHGRITVQKGIDSLLCLPSDLGGFKGRYRLIFYGRGDKEIESRLRSVIERSPDWLFIEGYNQKLTGKLIASASFVVMPSLWEPCGQVDMIGQLLGALPVVRAVGGLKKVRHRIDGFKYSGNDESGLLRNLQLAIKWEWNKQRKVSLMRMRAENVIYGRRIWRKILIRGYFPLYRKAKREIRH